MFQRLKSTLRDDTPRLLLDLLIVVAGVSISFALQDWRTATSERSTEARYLRSFADELELDRIELSRLIDVQEKAILDLRKVLQPTERALLGATEIDVAMDHALGYLTFSPANATYFELRQTGASRLIRDKALLQSILALYERRYAAAVEWDGISRKFVLDRIFPFIDEHGPSFLSGSRTTLAEGYHVVFMALEADPRFRNQLRSAILFKEGQLLAYQQCHGAVKSLLDNLRRR